MPNLWKSIEGQNVTKGEIFIWWLGGAGFVLKFSNGTKILLDAYLSDLIAKTHNLQRAYPSPISVEEVRPDIVIASHWHEDHLDPILCQSLRNNVDVKFVTTPTGLSRLLSWGVARENVQQLVSGEKKKIHDIEISGTFANHGDGTPGWETQYAMGIILEYDDLSIYHSGDTEYSNKLRDLKKYDLDCAMIVINGTGGNMNVYEASLLAWEIRSKNVIPMHHKLVKGGWPGATLDPNEFKRFYELIGGEGNVVLLDIGEHVIIT